LPGPHINPFCLAMSVRVSPCSHLKFPARDGDLSCLLSRILQRYRCTCPRSTPLHALPMAPPDLAASCPARRVFRLCRRWNFELPRTSHPSTLLALNSQVSLGFLCPLRLPMSPRGRPGFCIFRPCRRWSFESPRIPHPSAFPALKLRVSPRFAFRLRLLTI